MSRLPRGCALVRRVRDEPGSASAINQVFYGGGRPFRAATGRSFMQAFELTGDLTQRKVRVRGMDTGDQGPRADVEATS